MDALCRQISSLNVSEEMLLNIDTWQQDHIDHLGIYKELITTGHVYKVYSNGEIITSKNRPVKTIKLIQKNEDIFIITLIAY